MPAVKSVKSAYTDLSRRSRNTRRRRRRSSSARRRRTRRGHRGGLNLKLANEQISKLPASERAAVKGISSLSAEFGKLSKAFEPQAFRVFADGLKVVRNLLPHLAPMANAFGNAMGGLLKQLGSVTRSRGFSSSCGSSRRWTGPP